jgi:SAM-dependent methyltransferase
MAEYAEQKFGLPVTVGSIEVAQADLPEVDVVTLWDTIEHLHHPVRALANIRQLLGPGGLLIISTGDYDSWLRRITGRRWRLFADPTHNFFFTQATLTRLLDRTGFRVLSLERRGKWVSLAMVLHQSGFPFAPRLQRLLEGRGWNPHVYVNPGDVMTVYAQAIE